MPFSTRFAHLSWLLLLGLGVLWPAPTHAQKYHTAVGLRLGAGNYGLTIQQKILEKTTLEGLGLVGTREVSGGLLLEQHFRILGPSLNYYFGAGAHLGNHKDDGVFTGLDAIAGVEYKIPITRLVLSADFKPSVEFGAGDWARFPTAISVRYIFLKDRNRGLFGTGLFDGRKKKKKDKEKKKDKNKSGRKGLFGL